ncbi:ATP-dependent protease [Streptococcus equinus]|nr:ATP-dependent protease [Streptococcus equinus]
MYWRSGQQYVQAQKIFDSREDANAFRKELDFATELYETNLVVSNKGEF